jgi:hypothetical protein
MLRTPKHKKTRKKNKKKLASHTKRDGKLAHGEKMRRSEASKLYK